jgi:hypothetical protein
MLSDTTSVLLARNRMIQFGYKRKTEVLCSIAFTRPFSAPPSVVVTPAWEGANREVSHAETIGQITRTGFRLYSDNAASNYFVSWIAVGYLRGGTDENVTFLEVGDLLIEMGRTPKRSVTVTPQLLAGFGQPPSIQVSPFWNGQRRGVGHAETVGRVAQNSFDVLSDNGASNYFVSWLAVGTRRPDLPPNEEIPGVPGVHAYWDFPVGDMLIRTARIQVRHGGAGAVGLGVPAFAATPTVVLTPFWEGQGRGVTHAETLSDVEPHIIVRAADNSAENYFLSMLAIGPRR